MRCATRSTGPTSRSSRRRVSDYRPVEVAEQKIKKTGETLSLELVRNPDILGSARTEFGFEGVLVGFAAETERLEENARDKLVRKSCDLIVANDVSRRDIGFDSSQNEVLLVYADRSDPLAKDEKDHLAFHILDAIVTLSVQESVNLDGLVSPFRFPGLVSALATGGRCR